MTDSTRIVSLALLVMALDSCALQPPDDGANTDAALVGLRQFAPDPNTYRCVGLVYKEPDDAGQLPEGQSGFRKARIGGTFTVEKSTGLIRGFADNSAYEKHEVVFDPPDNSFYVISVTDEPNRRAEFLSIRDSVPGPDKPFLLVESGGVVTGICR